MKSIIILCFLAQLCASQYLYTNDNTRAEAAPQEISSLQHRARRQQPHQAAQISYRPLSHAPANIKQLLQLQQAREPIVNIPPQKPPQLGAPQGQPAQTAHAYRPQVQYGSAPSQPTYNNVKPQAPQYPTQQHAYPQYKPAGPPQQPAYPQYKPAGPPQQPAYPQYRAGGSQQQSQQPNYKAIYRPIQGPPVQEPQIQYSKQLPPQLQQLIQAHRPQ